MEFKKWYSTYEHPDHLYFIIQDNGDAGFYIYIYESLESFKKDIKDPVYCHHRQDDDLQDDLAMAQRATFHKYGVPKDSWAEITV